MTNFYFEAMGPNNEIIKGDKFASNEEEIASFLKLKKYTIITIEQKKESKLSLHNFASQLFGGVSLSEKANFARNLSTMIRSGLPISESLGVIADDSKSSKFKTILTNVKYDLESGRPLSKGMAKYPDVFDKIFVSLVSAGEFSGKMPEILTSIYRHFEKNIRLQNKMISAFTYPIVVLIALAIMGITMLILVVPKIIEVFVRMNIVLSFPLKMLNFASIIFIKDWFITVPSLIFAVLLLIIFFKSAYGQKTRSYFMRTLPFLSNLARSYDMARITSTLSLLLRSGVPMSDGLRIISVGIVDVALRDAVIDCEKKIKEGKSLSQAFNLHPDVMPPMLVKISKVGERSGKMDQVLSELGEYYDDQLDFYLKTMADLIEPIMMLIVGLIVAVLVLSIISPIYKLVGSFSAK